MKLTAKERKVYKELLNDAIDVTTGDIAQMEQLAILTAQVDILKQQVQKDGLTYTKEDPQGNTLVKKHGLLETLQRTQATLTSNLDKWNKYQLSKEKQYFARVYEENRDE
ncbi:hypothetical protein Q5H80_03055 [Vibrio sp. SNU_ST1]|uniref:hypothetical protein n=1 Tax=Vibrio sp. SNU_ST1 TaxID=3064001 RepID=UPI00272CFCB7|nr:hypothetical protein [Vibrio sp. SNU_ST1]WKY58644.1 hypothetical protein Q5H80_03055 [Vibrio sp. SNU_ST1]